MPPASAGSKAFVTLFNWIKSKVYCGPFVGPYDRLRDATAPLVNQPPGTIAPEAHALTILESQCIYSAKVESRH